MQYLLSEEEYNNLHGEGDDEMDALKIENMKLKVVMTTFVDKIDDIRTVEMGHRMGAKYLNMSIRLDDIPQEVVQILEDKYRDLPNNPIQKF